MEPNKFYFRDGPYVQTLKGLYKALSSSEAFVTLLGNANTGKSSLCRLLANYLQRKDFRTVYFHYAIESPEMLRSMLARELDIPESANFPRLVEDALLHGDGKPVVLIFDDAHLLTDVTLLEIYRLAEIQADNRRLLNILLCGEPSLEQQLLSRKEFKTLLLNISNKFLLEPMDVETTSLFISSYLEKAGLPGVELEPAAMTYFWKSCKGFPGPAASICQIIVRSRAGQTELTPLGKQELALLIQGSAEVQSVPGLSVVNSNQWFLLGPLAAVVVIASIGLIYQQLRSEVEPAREGAGPVAALSEDSPFSAVQTVEVQPESVPDTQLVALPAAEDPVPAPGPAASTVPAAEPAAAGPQAQEPEVSDSSLALVTAAERGIDQSELVAPVFEDLLEVVEEPPAAPNVLRLEDDQELVLQAAVELQPETAVADPPALAQTEIETPVAVENSGETELAIATQGDLEQQLIASVNRWVEAWQAQQLNEYFAAYHEDFLPRYQDTVSEWRANRERVIGNAEWIRLQMSEFEIVNQSPDLVEVNFWLAYESPTYSDNTLKKLVFGRAGEDWLIVEEVNLEVRQ